MQVVTYLHSRFQDFVSEGDLEKRSELEGAFDEALQNVERSLAAGLNNARGKSARPELEKLADELTKQRRLAIERGAVDREWLQSTLRWVVEWLPETEITLIASFGRIARAAVVPP
jgi:hypothetical protein